NMGTLFTSDLKEGMVTLVDTYSSKGKLVLTKNTVITKSIIDKLVKNDVLFVEITDESKRKSDQLDLTNRDASADSEVLNEENPIVQTNEFKKFKRRYENNLDDIKENLNDIVHKNAKVDIDTMLKGTNNILKASQSPLGVFTMLSSIKSYDDSTFTHSLNVSLICNIIGTWLELSPNEIELLTLCGLLHDIGKLLIPERILKKPDKLTDDEYKIIKTHTKKGYEILKDKKMDLHIQYAALMHHEKCDGSGYPLGLKQEQIDWYSQIVTIADIYDAMTSKRVYRGAINPFTVINTFEKDGLKKYNPQYLMTFFEHVVNSYMNCKVQLSNGQEGDIVYINKVNLSRPMIKTKDSFIDLSKSSGIEIERIL
ncbi:MAG: HD-GYP domain-containing protein, partial [Wujia sp.]